MSTKNEQTWEEACIQDRGRVLSGRYAHSCPDWDGLVIDETCPGEWPCVCKPEIDAMIAAGTWFKESD